jgi:hypothetical protein
MRSLLGLEPGRYRPHMLHGSSRVFVESNCYTDVVVELLHARGDEPLAGLGTTVRVDFEGDQWTFFKPDPEDLRTLFGVDVHEMMPYRPLPDQIAEQLELGRTLIVEVDSWYLPDTWATTYHREHVKTSVALEAIDVGGQALRYFHATALHQLADEDFRGVLRMNHAAEDALAPYTELVRFDGGSRLAADELRATAQRLFRGHLRHRPADNPFPRFAARLADDLVALGGADGSQRHAYTFATARMAGAAFEICQNHVEWLYGPDAMPAAKALGTLVEGSKTLVFKLARRRRFDSAPLMGELGEAWEEAMAAMENLAG